MPHPKKTANAEKQRKFRERQKAAGKKLVRGYITPKAMDNYRELSEKTGWTDSEMLSNALRITYAAYKNGQIPLLNKWLLEQDQKQQRKDELAKKKALKSASSEPSK